MLDCLTQSYPDKRLGKRFRNDGVPLYIGVLLHKFHCNWSKGYSSFSGGDRFMGFFISGFYCIRREKHKIRKSFDTQCDIRLTFVLMSFWHRGYHLCLMSLNVIRKKKVEHTFNHFSRRYIETHIIPATFVLSKISLL